MQTNAHALATTGTQEIGVLQLIACLFAFEPLLLHVLHEVINPCLLGAAELLPVLDQVLHINPMFGTQQPYRTSLQPAPEYAT